jgi:hypothetical protein
MRRKPKYRKATKPHVIPKTAHPIVQFIFKQMNKRKMTMMHLGDTACISNQTIAEWGRVRSEWGDKKSPTSPSIVTVEKALNALGYRLSIKLLEEKPSEKIRHTERIS